MSETGEDKSLEDSISEEIRAYDEFGAKARNIASLVPWLDAKREEAEVKLYAVRNAPRDFISEVGSQLLESQRRDTERARSLSQSVAFVDADRVRFSASGTSSSDFSQVIITTFPEPDKRPAWVPPIIDRFSSVAERKAKAESLPRAMDVLKLGLGQAFTVAEESIAKAKSGLLQPHQAANSMRIAIQDTWGALLIRARKASAALSEEKHYELKKPTHRAIASGALVSPEYRPSYEHNLETLYSVYRDLSVLSKKSGTPPLKLLHDLRTRWIFALDAVVTSLPAPE